MPTTPRSPGFSPGDVVVVPFPFTDRTATKKRPALVCSSRAFNDASGHVVLAMITSSDHTPWPSDVRLSANDVAGLPLASTVRWKLFTLDQRLILRAAGALADSDLTACRRASPVWG